MAPLNGQCCLAYARLAGEHDYPARTGCVHRYQIRVPASEMNRGRQLAWRRAGLAGLPGCRLMDVHIATDVARLDGRAVDGAADLILGRITPRHTLPAYAI